MRRRILLVVLIVVGLLMAPLIRVQRRVQGFCEKINLPETITNFETKAKESHLTVVTSEPVMTSLGTASGKTIASDEWLFLRWKCIAGHTLGEIYSKELLSEFTFPSIRAMLLTI